MVWLCRQVAKDLLPPPPPPPHSVDEYKCYLHAGGRGDAGGGVLPGVGLLSLCDRTMSNWSILLFKWFTDWNVLSLNQDCGTGQNRINLGTPAPEPEPYSEYGSGYKEMKEKTQKIY